MMINDDWSPWLVSVLRLPQVKHLQRDKIKRIFDDLCGPKWEFTKQPAWFRKDMKRHGTSTMLQQLPKKKMRFTHPIGAISWDGTTTRAALGPKKQCIHRGWFLRFLWLHISASGSAFGRVTVGVFHDGPVDPRIQISWDVFLPRKPTWQGKIQDFKMYLLLSKGGFSIAMFVLGGVVDNMEPALKNCYLRGVFEGDSGLRGCWIQWNAKSILLRARKNERFLSLTKETISKFWPHCKLWDTSTSFLTVCNWCITLSVNPVINELHAFSQNWHLYFLGGISNGWNVNAFSSSCVLQNI